MVMNYLLTDIKWPRKVDFNIYPRTSVSGILASWKGFILHAEIKGSAFGTAVMEPFPYLGPLYVGDKGLSSVNNSAFST